MKALIFIEENFEDLEFYYPYYRLIEEGYSVDVISTEKKTVAGKHAYTFISKLDPSKIDTINYDLLVIPGGKAPEKLRLNKKILEITKHFFLNNKPVAAICHGIQVLISANLIKNRKCTCWVGIKDDLIAAGGIYIDKEVVVDNNLVTSRKPSDLPFFMRELFKLI